MPGKAHDQPQPEATGTPPASSTLNNMRRELARGTAELAVLSALRANKRYGYELLKLLEGAGDGVLEIREGTLYPLLHRLEDAGHITSAWEAQGRARPRKYYAITAEGSAHLSLLRTEWRALVTAVHEILTKFDEV